MSDESEPTPEELEAAKALSDYLDGKPSPALDQRAKNTADFLRMALHSPSAERVEAVKARLQLRRKARWSRRIGLAAAVMAMVLVVWFAARPVPLPEPGPDVVNAGLDAAKKGDPKAVDLAMSGYRGKLVKIGLLKGAEDVHTRADAAIAAGDFPAAREALSTLQGRGGAIERDAWFRLATVELRAGRTDAAIANAERGLSMGRRMDMFTVNLLLARAAAYEARGDARAAAKDLGDVMDIYEALLDRALDGK